MSLDPHGHTQQVCLALRYHHTKSDMRRVLLGLDTAGFLLEVITRQNFKDYLQAHICRPLNLKSTSFIPPPGLPDSIASCTVIGDSTSEWQKVDYPMSRNPEMHAGGSGLYSTAEEFSLILAEVLNDGGRLFEHAETAGLLFESQLTPAARRDLGVFMQSLLATSPDIAKVWETAKLEFGLGYLVNAKDIVEKGRKAGTGSWGGMSGTTAWIDRKTGIAVSHTFTFPLCVVN
jgi:methyl acetate hydrolase